MFITDSNHKLTHQYNMALVTHTGSFTLNLFNEHIVYEKSVYCEVKESDFNLSYNPTLISSSLNTSSSIRDFATGSFFEPYVTMIGLYNESNELLAVAKFAKPIPISHTSDMTFIIKMDW
jgi:hypothetical protein